MPAHLERGRRRPHARRPGPATSITSRSAFFARRPALAENEVVRERVAESEIDGRSRLPFFLALWAHQTPANARKRRHKAKGKKSTDSRRDKAGSGDVQHTRAKGG